MWVPAMRVVVNFMLVVGFWLPNLAFLFPDFGWFWFAGGWLWCLALLWLLGCGVYTPMFVLHYDLAN